MGEIGVKEGLGGWEGLREIGERKDWESGGDGRKGWIGGDGRKRKMGGDL